MHILKTRVAISRAILCGVLLKTLLALERRQFAEILGMRQVA